MPLFSGFQISNTIKAQELNLKASLEDLKKARESLSVTIASAYLQVLFNKELLQLAKDQEALSLQQLDRYQSMAALGKIPECQVSEIKALYANNQLETSRAQSNLQLALLDLAQLIELDDWTSFDSVVPAIDVKALALQLTRPMRFTTVLSA
jgi:outer membrane protein